MGSKKQSKNEFMTYGKEVNIVFRLHISSTVQVCGFRISSLVMCMLTTPTVEDEKRTAGSYGDIPFLPTAPLCVK
jgi:hypothetical protein